MLRLLVCFLFGAVFSLSAEKEYYCYKPVQDTYLFADPGQKDDCEENGGKFGSFSRKKFKWFCNMIDSGFMIGQKNSETKAKELCGSGKLQKPK